MQDWLASDPQVTLHLLRAEIANVYHYAQLHINVGPEDQTRALIHAWQARY